MTEKHDTEKLRYYLIPTRALAEVVEVLGFGAKKYSDNGWLKVTTPRRRYFAAAMRHLWAWWRGEELDAESGFSHLAHAGASILFLIELGRYGDNVDTNVHGEKV